MTTFPILTPSGPIEWPLTLQEAFNRLWHRPEPTPCVYNSCCRYNYDGNQCDIGYLMSEEQQILANEYGGFMSLYGGYKRNWNEKFPQFTADQINLFAELQRCHDQAVRYGRTTKTFQHERKQLLREFATAYELTIPSETV